MTTAVWNGTIIAQSSDTITVEGNHYFPPDSIRRDYFQKNDHHTVCYWKGQASYYDVVVDGKVNQAASWYYPNPSEPARQIKDYVAFWKGITVRE